MCSLYSSLVSSFFCLPCLETFMSRGRCGVNDAKLVKGQTAIATPWSFRALPTHRRRSVSLPIARLLHIVGTMAGLIARYPSAAPSCKKCISTAHPLLGTSISSTTTNCRQWQWGTGTGVNFNHIGDQPSIVMGFEAYVRLGWRPLEPGMLQDEDLEN